MRRNKFKRITATFLLLIFIGQMLMPTISYALTSGPTAPEYTSFEPVDTTDMVNLSTGDLVYNMPLLEVPGPEGGFPLSLSYHSGITLNEEASWVGLGWTLNPGAIVRTVNGNPDDQIGVKRTVLDFDRGAERHTFSVGIGTPAASFGLDVSFDSNLGVGVGYSASASLLPVEQIKKLGVSPYIGGGVDPYGGGYAAIGLAAQSASGLSSSISLQTNFNMVGIGAGFGYQGLQLGASLSSEGIRASSSVAGFRFNQSNSQAGSMTTEGFNISAPIPLGSGVFLNLGYKYLRYYSDEKSEVNIIGSLHGNQTFNKNPDEWAFDSYALLDPDQFGGIVKRNDPEVLFGGSFPSYDQYMVNTQGVSGSIEPYILDNGTLFRQNVKVRDNEADYLIKYNPINTSFGFSGPANFRFKNDFSNVFAYESNKMNIRSVTDIGFDNQQSIVTPAQGYNTARQQLAGSKHIEWFTNQEILNGVGAQKGFMNYHDNVTLSDRTKFLTYDVSEQAGGFMITNETGVTYHYALPVYAYGENMRVEKINDPGKFHNEDNPHPYAYTWLLTAITGPDFVDHNENQLVDENDWGYWVRFDYGSWTNEYSWRNPGTGFHLDLDNETQMKSSGKKQLIYLNSISTRTHTAYFIKSERTDGKGLSDLADPGRYKPFVKQIPPSEDQRFIAVYPATQLKLDKIILIKNEEAARLNLDDFKTSGVLTNQLNGKLAEVNESVTRAINFNFGYELCQNTENSFEFIRNEDQLNINSILYSSLKGKLTLKSVQFGGVKSLTGLIPPVTFEYGQNEPYADNYYDIWGFYKSDYAPSVDENLSRSVSAESSTKLDAWSLLAVNTSLGARIEVEYESDSYRKSSIDNSFLLQVVNPIPKPGSVDEIEFDIVGATNDLSYLEGHDVGSLFLLFNTISNHITVLGQEPECSPSNCGFVRNDLQGELFSENLVVTEVNGTRLSAKNQSLHEKLSSKEGAPRIIDSNCENCTVSEILFEKHIYISGYLKTTEDFNRLGGGIRVKRLIVNNVPSDEKFITEFSFTRDGKTSGSISYEPVNLVNDNLIFPNNLFFNSNSAIREDFGNRYKIELQKNYSKLLAITRELPGPGVMYSHVTISDKVARGTDTTFAEGKKVYEFQTYETDLVKRSGRSNDRSQVISRCVIFDGDGREEPINCSSTSPPPDRCYNSTGQVVPCGQSTDSFGPTTIQDFSSWLGALKKTSLIGDNGQVISETTNHYLHDGKEHGAFVSELNTKFGGQGIISQIFNENKQVREGASTFNRVYVFSRKDEYPLVNLGQTTTNFKTGVTTTTTNKEFDFYSGLPVKVESTDSYGNKFLSVTEPAYKHYPAMGLKVITSTNKHMLSQTAANYNYKMAANGTNSGLLSASIQTWSDQIPALGSETPQTNIWRQHEAYQWNGQQALALDGTYPLADFTTFNFANLAANTKWEKTGGITLYDIYSHALEATDINSNFASTRMDPKQQFVTASTANASYQEMAYSGIEYSSGNIVSEGDVSRGNGSPTPARAHTGKYSLLTGFNKMGFNYTLNPTKTDLNKKYRASVWVYMPGESETQPQLDQIQLVAMVNGVDQSVHPVLQKSKSKSWYLMNLDFDPQGQETIIKCMNNSSRGVYFDDFRVHPLNASMTSYVYDSFSGELNYILDGNNFYTRFEYDAMGRLVRTSREMLNFDFGPGKETFKADRILNEVIYNYGKQN